MNYYDEGNNRKNTWMQGINSHYSTINLVKEGNGVHKDCLKLIHNLKSSTRI